MIGNTTSYSCGCIARQIEAGRFVYDKICREHQNSAGAEVEQDIEVEEDEMYYLKVIANELQSIRKILARQQQAAELQARRFEK